MEALLMSPFSPRASLPSLPQELQDKILAYSDVKGPYPRLRLNDQRRDHTLFYLSCTCKALRATCLPLLFQDVAFTAYTYGAHEANRALGREAALLRSVSSGSCLGQHIRTLHIKRLFPNDRTVEQILEYTPRLERLTCMFYLNHRSDSDGACIETQRLSNALSRVSTTLKHLEIGYRMTTMRPRRPKNQPTFPAWDVECNLQHLTALESLRIPLTLLLGWQLEVALADVLPPNLVSVHFTRIPQRQWEEMPKVEPMAMVLKPFVERGKWRESTPNLRSVSGHMRVDGCAGKAAMVELHRRSVVVKKLLNDNGLDLPEDVEKLGGLTGFFSMPHHHNDENSDEYRDREITWQSLGFES
jgi:hypothetical protein